MQRKHFILHQTQECSRDIGHHGGLLPLEAMTKLFCIDFDATVPVATFSTTFGTRIEFAKERPDGAAIVVNAQSQIARQGTFQID